MTGEARLRRKTDIQLSLAATRCVEAMRAVQECLDARDAAVADWIRRAGLSTRKTGPQLRATLKTAGFTDEEIRMLGVSDGNLRLIKSRFWVQSQNE